LYLSFRPLRLHFTGSRLAIATVLTENQPTMNALVILGVVVDVLMALLLLLVFGWIMDSWHDPNGAWVGVVVTTLWLLAFISTTGAAGLGLRLRHRRVPPGRVALVVWLPAALLVGICVIGFTIAPP
jgi:hypothetical protein